jgi:hypothetical protein
MDHRSSSESSDTSDQESSSEDDDNEEEEEDAESESEDEAEEEEEEEDFESDGDQEDIDDDVAVRVSSDTNNPSSKRNAKLSKEVVPGINHVHFFMEYRLHDIYVPHHRALPTPTHASFSMSASGAYTEFARVL